MIVNGLMMKTWIKRRINKAPDESFDTITQIRIQGRTEPKVTTTK